MTITIAEIELTNRFKTVEDCNEGFDKLNNFEDAVAAKVRVRADWLDEAEMLQVKFRIKKAFGDYLIQARLVTAREKAQRTPCKHSVHEGRRLGCSICMSKWILGIDWKTEWNKEVFLA